MLVIVIWLRGCLADLPKSISYSCIYSLLHQKAKWETRVKMTKRLISLWNAELSGDWNSLEEKWWYQGAMRFLLPEIVELNRWPFIEMCWKRRVWLEQMTSKVQPWDIQFVYSFHKHISGVQTEGIGSEVRVNGHAPSVHLSPLLTQAVHPRSPARNVAPREQLGRKQAHS